MRVSLRSVFLPSSRANAQSGATTSPVPPVGTGTTPRAPTNTKRNHSSTLEKLRSIPVFRSSRTSRSTAPNPASTKTPATVPNPAWGINQNSDGTVIPMVHQTVPRPEGYPDRAAQYTAWMQGRSDAERAAMQIAAGSKNSSLSDEAIVPVAPSRQTLTGANLSILNKGSQGVPPKPADDSMASLEDKSKSSIDSSFPAQPEKSQQIFERGANPPSTEGSEDKLVRPIPHPTKSNPLIGHRDFGFPPSSGIASSTTDQQAVYTQDNSLNTENLHVFAQRLQALFPEIPPGGSDENRERLLVLKTVLEAISVAAKKEQHPDKDAMLHIRDCFETASKIAYMIGHSKSSKVSSDPEVTRVRKTYEELAGCLFWLKRIHLSNSADRTIREYVDKVEEKTLEHNPNFKNITSSTIVKTTGASLTFNQAGAFGGIGGTVTKTKRWDEDLGFNDYVQPGISLFGGFSPFIARITGTLGLEGIKSRYFESTSYSDVEKLSTLEKADKTFMTSASKVSRDFHDNFQKGYNNFVKGFLFDVDRTEVPGDPYYLSSAKISLGADSTGLLQHAASLEKITGGDGSILDLLSKAYPTTADKLGNEEVHGPVQNPVNDVFPISRPIGIDGMPSRLVYLQGDARIGKYVDVAGAGLSGGGEAYLTTRGQLAEFDLQAMEASHRILDPHYHADPKSTYELNNMLDALLEVGTHHNTKAAAPAKLKMYSRVHYQFGGKEWPAREAQLIGKYGPTWWESQAFKNDLYSPEKEDRFGPIMSVPPQFRVNLLHETTEDISEKIRQAGNKCARYEKRYRDFVANGCTVFYAPVPGASAETKAHFRQTREAAFHEINEAIWKSEEVGGGYPGGVKRALKDPVQFLAETHDAMGMGLGALSMHIMQLKFEMREKMDHASELEISERMLEIEKMDRKYLDVKNDMDKCYLPIKLQDIFLKGSTFRDSLLSRRYAWRTNIGGKAGLSNNFGAAAADDYGRKEESTAMHIGKAPEDVSMPNNGLHVFLDGTVEVLVVPNQKPSRKGVFVRCEIKGGHGALPFIPQAMKMTPHILAKIRSLVSESVKLLDPNASTDKARKQTDDIMSQFQGLVWEGTNFYGMEFRLRVPPGAPLHEMKLQQIRQFSSVNAGPKLGIPFPFFAGYGKVEGSRKLDIKKLEGEVIGPELGYQILQHPRLKEVINAAETASKSISGATLSKDEVLSRMLSNNVAEEDSLGLHFKSPNVTVQADASIVAKAYFTHPTAIMSMIDDYEVLKSRVNDMEEQNKLLPDDKKKSRAELKQENEFFMYFATNEKKVKERFLRTADVARDIRQLAAGASAKIDSIKKDKIAGNRLDVEDNTTDMAWQSTTTSLNPFERPEKLSKLLDMPKDLDWATEREAISKLKNLDERIAYYTAPPGNRVLEYYVKILDTTKEVHDLSRKSVTPTTIGYQTRLAQRKERKKAEVVRREKETPPARKATRYNRIMGRVNLMDVSWLPPRPQGLGTAGPDGTGRWRAKAPTTAPDIINGTTAVTPDRAKDLSTTPVPVKNFSRPLPAQPPLKPTATPPLRSTDRKSTPVITTNSSVPRFKEPLPQFYLEHVYTQNGFSGIEKNDHTNFFNHIFEYPKVPRPPRSAEELEMATGLRHTNTLAGYTSVENGVETHHAERPVAGKWPIDQFGTAKENIGGGACMLHALYGFDLDREQIRKVCTEMKNAVLDSPEDTSHNAHQIVSALLDSGQSLQQVDSLMYGRDHASNEAYGALLMLPGLWMGTNELKILSGLEKIRNSDIVVIDNENGTAEHFIGGERYPIPDSEVLKAAAGAKYLLHKEGGHWVRVRRANGPLSNIQA